MTKTIKTAAGSIGTSSGVSLPVTKRLTPLELKCMKALWLERAQTVREVHQILQPSHPLAYTTILTVMDRLAQKGSVARSKRGKAYIYKPTGSFKESRNRAVTDLIQAYFDGSEEELMAFLVEKLDRNQTHSSKIGSSPQLNECLL